MLNPKLSPVTPAAPAGNVIVAGQNCGIRILCTPKAYETYKEVDALSRKGNHWARLIIKGIAALSSGRINSDNVFVKKGLGMMYAQQRGAFYVSLPGVLATFEDLDGTSYVLTHFKADTSYFKHQQQATKPGLWRVSRNDIGSWSAQFVKNGRLISKQENRYVVVADRNYESPNKAAESAAASLSNTHDTIRSSIEKTGFDLHFTPGIKKIAGLSNLKETYMASSAPTLRESAQLLANTMYRSRDVNSVFWYSDWGGSGILTQSMRLLNDQQIKLEKHAVLMNHPTTLPSVAESLARKIGLDPIKGGHKGMLPRELLGRLLTLDTPVGALRQWREDKNYTGKELVADAGKKLFGAGDTLSGAIGVAGAIGIIAATSPILTIAGITGTVYFVVNKALKVYEGRRR